MRESAQKNMNLLDKKLLREKYTILNLLER